jgi:hypothetical protein
MLETSQAAIAAPPVASIKLGFLFFFFFLSVILFSAVYRRLEGCTVSISFSLGVIVRFHKLLKGMMRDYPRPEQVTFYH